MKAVTKNGSETAELLARLAHLAAEHILQARQNGATQYDGRATTNRGLPLFLSLVVVTSEGVTGATQNKNTKKKEQSMDYYTRNRARKAAEAKRAQRIETLKTIGTVVVTLPVLWVIAVLFLCI